MTGPRILPLTGLEPPERAAAQAGAEAIFWESAGTRNFAEECERAAYRALWFGRYLEHAPHAFFLAFAGDGAVAGYLAGSRISDGPPLPGPDYYRLFLPALIARHPAHLHVNVRADRRGAGLGGVLVAAFLAHCAASGIPGAHAVTAAGSRAAAFFQRCGLALQAEANWHGRDLVFLAAQRPARQDGSSMSLCPR